MAITQEDCISAHRAEKKRKTPTGPSTAQPPRYRLLQNTATRAPPRNNQPGRWVPRLPQQARFNQPPTPQPEQQQQKGPRLSFPPSYQRNNNYHCFNCGSPSHFIKDCPQPRRSFQGQTSNLNNKGKGKKQMVQVRQGRVNFTTLSELPEDAPIMTGTFSINHQLVIILFYSGATHSFISSKCGTKIGLNLYPTSGAYTIATPGGKISSNQVYKSVPIQMGRNLVRTDLLLLDLEGMDVIRTISFVSKFWTKLICPNSLCILAVRRTKI
jgi:hypothetical protein